MTNPLGHLYGDHLSGRPGRIPDEAGEQHQNPHGESDAAVAGAFTEGYAAWIALGLVTVGWRVFKWLRRR